MASTTWPSRSSPSAGSTSGPSSDDAGVPVHEEGGTSLYFQGPDGERIELIADPLGEMYGSPVV